MANEVILFQPQSSLVLNDRSVSTNEAVSAHNVDETAHPYIQGRISGHVSDKNNPHAVTKEQVGLGNCDNTSDLNKPISTATQTALNAKQDTLPSGTTGYYLQKTADGMQWSSVDALPSQSEHNGQFLTTNGASASWVTIPSLSDYLPLTGGKMHEPSSSNKKVKIEFEVDQQATSPKRANLQYDNIYGLEFKNNSNSASVNDANELNLRNDGKVELTASQGESVIISSRDQNGDKECILTVDTEAKINNSLIVTENTVGFRKLSEVYINGTSWYKVFDEYVSSASVRKWCEQGGVELNITPNQWISVTFLKEFADTNYTVVGSGVDPSVSTVTPDQFFAYRSPLRTTGFDGGIRYLSGGATYADRGFSWYACGYIS